MAVSAGGSVAVGGVDYVGGGCRDGWTVAYTTSGARRWSASFGGAAGLTDEVSAVAFGPAGSVYAAGRVGALFKCDDGLVVRYAADGTRLWYDIRDGGGSGGDAFSHLAVAATGTVYATGTGHMIAGNTQYIRTLGLTAAGAYLWSKWVSPSFDCGADAESILLAGDQLYVGGKTQKADFTWTAVIMSYAVAPGGVDWSVGYDAGGTWGSCWVNSLALSGSTGLYVAGSSAVSPQPYSWDGYTMRVVP